MMLIMGVIYLKGSLEVGLYEVQSAYYLQSVAVGTVCHHFRKTERNTSMEVSDVLLWIVSNNLC